MERVTLDWARRTVAIAVLLLTITAVPAHAAINVSGAKSLARKRAKSYIKSVIADTYRIRSCSRTSSTKVLCSIRIVGANDGAYSCSLFVEIVQQKGRLQSTLKKSTC